MPIKNAIKQFAANSYYHIYNRGIEKRPIFHNDKDYIVFMRFLKEYLLPPDHPDLKSLLEKTPFRHPVNCANDIELLVFCLMPNHFHLLIKQKTERGMSKFMKALSSNYVNYFNNQSQREGHLFQGIYKAVMIETNEQLLHVSRYIHKNPLPLLPSGIIPPRRRDDPSKNPQLLDYPYSSYRHYLGFIKYDWVKPAEILSFFSNSHPRSTYHYFVENQPENLDPIKSLTLDY